MSRHRRQRRQREPSFKEKVVVWYASKAPLLQFALKFIVLVGVYYVISSLPLFQQFVSLVAIANAWLSGFLLHLAGENVLVTSATLASSSGPIITVLPTCTAVELVWFFCAAVIAFPALYKQKIAGVLVGIFSLSGLNLVRLISLYLVGVYLPKYLDIVHEDIWLIPSNCFTIALIIGWIVWTKHDDSIVRARTAPNDFAIPLRKSAASKDRVARN